MKKFLANVLLFIPFLLTSYFIFLIAWGSFAPGHLRKNLIYGIGGYANMYSRICEAKKMHNVDILFLGASHTYRGFDPRIFKEYGYNTFNLGSPNQTPLQTEILLERYLNNLNPKLIIYEVHPWPFLLDGVESALDLLANDKIDMSSVKMALILNNVKAYNTLIYSWYRQLFDLDNGFKEEMKKEDDTYISGGYVEKKLSFNSPEAEKKEEIPVTLAHWKPKAYQLIAFERILKIIKDKNIEMVFVQAPVTKMVFNVFDGNDKFDAFISSKTDHYINFNYLMKLDDSLDFFDSHHLNQQGVRVFNEALLKGKETQLQNKVLMTHASFKK